MTLDKIIKIIEEKFPEEGQHIAERLKEDAGRFNELLDITKDTLSKSAEKTIRNTIVSLRSNDEFIEAFCDFLSHQHNNFVDAANEIDSPQGVKVLALKAVAQLIEEQVLPEMIANVCNNMIDFWIFGCKLNFEANICSRYTEEELQEFKGFFQRMAHINYSREDAHRKILAVVKKKERAFEQALEEEYESREKKKGKEKEN